MPIYDYECPTCGRHTTAFTRIEHRDFPTLCGQVTNGVMCWTELRRVPSAPSFSIKGFNAANGYARRADR